MAVEIVIHINAKNLTGRKFDQLIATLKELCDTTNEIEHSAEGFGKRLADVRTQLRNVVIGAGAFTASFALAGTSLIQAAIEVEGVTNGLTALKASTD